jgi:hypothetical protein
MLSRSSSSSSFFVSSSGDEEHGTSQDTPTVAGSKVARFEEMQVLFRTLELKPSLEELTRSSTLTSLNEESAVDFEIPDTPESITFDDAGNIHTATAPKLIEKLTSTVGTLMGMLILVHR